MRSARTHSISLPASSSSPSLRVRARALRQPLRDAAGHLLRRHAVGVGERLLRRACPEAVDSDHQTVADDAIPIEPACGLNRDEPGPAVRYQLALLVAGPF